jgi:hypothetical protein
MAAADFHRSFADAQITISDDGGNSAVLGGVTGNISVSGMVPQGRGSVVVQAQGANTGARLGERVNPTVSITGNARRFDSDAQKIAMGVIAGYVSTTADIGDDVRCDIELDDSVSTDTRLCTFDDARVTFSYTVSPGGTGEFTMEFEPIGPVVLDGVTYIPAR